MLQDSQQNKTEPLDSIIADKSLSSHEHYLRYLELSKSLSGDGDQISLLKEACLHLTIAVCDHVSDAKKALTAFSSEISQRADASKIINRELVTRLRKITKESSFFAEAQLQIFSLLYARRYSEIYIHFQDRLNDLQLALTALYNYQVSEHRNDNHIKLMAKKLIQGYPDQVNAASLFNSAFSLLMFEVIGEDPVFTDGRDSQNRNYPFRMQKTSQLTHLPRQKSFPIDFNQVIRAADQYFIKNFFIMKCFVSKPISPPALPGYRYKNPGIQHILKTSAMSSQAHYSLPKLDDQLLSGQSSILFLDFARGYEIARLIISENSFRLIAYGDYLKIQLENLNFTYYYFDNPSGRLQISHYFKQTDCCVFECNAEKLIYTGFAMESTASIKKMNFVIRGNITISSHTKMNTTSLSIKADDLTQQGKLRCKKQFAFDISKTLAITPGSITHSDESFLISAHLIKELRGKISAISQFKIHTQDGINLRGAGAITAKNGVIQARTIQSSNRSTIKTDDKLEVIVRETINIDKESLWSSKILYVAAEKIINDSQLIATKQLETKAREFTNHFGRLSADLIKINGDHFSNTGHLEAKQGIIFNLNRIAIHGITSWSDLIFAIQNNTGLPSINSPQVTITSGIYINLLGKVSCRDHLLNALLEINFGLLMASGMTSKSRLFTVDYGIDVPNFDQMVRDISHFLTVLQEGNIEKICGEVFTTKNLMSSISAARWFVRNFVPALGKSIDFVWSAIMLLMKLPALYRQMKILYDKGREKIQPCDLVALLGTISSVENQVYSLALQTEGLAQIENLLEMKTEQLPSVELVWPKNAGILLAADAATLFAPMSTEDSLFSVQGGVQLGGTEIHRTMIGSQIGRMEAALSISDIFFKSAQIADHKVAGNISLLGKQLNVAESTMMLSGQCSTSAAKQEISGDILALSQVCLTGDSVRTSSTSHLYGADVELMGHDKVEDGGEILAKNVGMHADKQLILTDTAQTTAETVTGTAENIAQNSHIHIVHNNNAPAGGSTANQTQKADVFFKAENQMDIGQRSNVDGDQAQVVMDSKYLTDSGTMHVKEAHERGSDSFFRDKNAEISAEKTELRSHHLDEAGQINVVSPPADEKSQTDSNPAVIIADEGGEDDTVVTEASSRINAHPHDVIRLSGKHLTEGGQVYGGAIVNDAKNLIQTASSYQTAALIQLNAEQQTLSGNLKGKTVSAKGGNIVTSSTSHINGSNVKLTGNNIEDGGEIDAKDIVLHAEDKLTLTETAQTIAETVDGIGTVSVIGDNIVISPTSHIKGTDVSLTASYVTDGGTIEAKNVVLDADKQLTLTSEAETTAETVNGKGENITQKSHIHIISKEDAPANDAASKQTQTADVSFKAENNLDIDHSSTVDGDKAKVVMDSKHLSDSGTLHVKEAHERGSDSFVRDGYAVTTAEKIELRSHHLNDAGRINVVSPSSTDKQSSDPAVIIADEGGADDTVVTAATSQINANAHDVIQLSGKNISEGGKVNSGQIENQGDHLTQTATSEQKATIIKLDAAQQTLSGNLSGYSVSATGDTITTASTSHINGSNVKLTGNNVEDSGEIEAKDVVMHAENQLTLTETAQTTAETIDGTGKDITQKSHIHVIPKENSPAVNGIVNPTTDTDVSFKATNHLDIDQNSNIDGDQASAKMESKQLNDSGTMHVKKAYEHGSDSLVRSKDAVITAEKTELRSNHLENGGKINVTPPSSTDEDPTPAVTIADDGGSDDSVTNTETSQINANPTDMILLKSKNLAEAGKVNGGVIVNTAENLTQTDTSEQKGTIIELDATNADINHSGLEAKQFNVNVKNLANPEDLMTHQGKYDRVKVSDQMNISTPQDINFNKIDDRKLDTNISVTCHSANVNANLHTVKDLTLDIDTDFVVPKDRIVMSDQKLQIHTKGNYENHGYVGADVAEIDYDNRFINTGTTQGLRHLVIKGVGDIENTCTQENYRGDYGAERVHYTPGHILGGTGDGYGNVGLEIYTQGKLKTTGSEICSIGDNHITALQGFEFYAPSHHYMSFYKSKPYWWGKNVTSWDFTWEWQKSLIYSANGKNELITPNGYINSLSTDFVAAKGTDVFAPQGNLHFYGIINTTEHHRTSDWFGFNEAEDESWQEDVPTRIINYGGDIRVKCVDGDFGDTQVYTPGQFKVDAVNFKISNPILNNSSTKSDISPTATPGAWTQVNFVNSFLDARAAADSSDPTAVGCNALNFGVDFVNNTDQAMAAFRGDRPISALLSNSITVASFDITSSNSSSRWQTTGSAEVHCGSLDFEIKNTLEFDNGVPITVDRDAKIRARRFLQNGATQHSLTTSDHRSIGFDVSLGGDIIPHIKADNESVAATTHTPQQFKVGGKADIVVGDWKMDGAENEFGQLVGHADTLTMTSQLDTVTSSSDSFSADTQGNIAVQQGERHREWIGHKTRMIIGDADFSVGEGDLQGSEIDVTGKDNFRFDHLKQTAIDEQDQGSSWGISGNINILNKNTENNHPPLPSFTIQHGRIDNRATQESTIEHRVSDPAHPSGLVWRHQGQYDYHIKVPIVNERGWQQFSSDLDWTSQKLESIFAKHEENPVIPDHPSYPTAHPAHSKHCTAPVTHHPVAISPPPVADKEQKSPFFNDDLVATYLRQALSRTDPSGDSNYAGAIARGAWEGTKNTVTPPLLFVEDMIVLRDAMFGGHVFDAKDVMVSFLRMRDRMHAVKDFSHLMADFVVYSNVELLNSIDNPIGNRLEQSERFQEAKQHLGNLGSRIYFDYETFMNSSPEQKAETLSRLTTEVLLPYGILKLGKMGMNEYYFGTTSNPPLFYNNSSIGRMDPSPEMQLITVDDIRATPGQQDYIFVIDPKRRLFITPDMLPTDKDGLPIYQWEAATHPELVQWGPVLTAGNITAENGYLTKIDPTSGHYRPQGDHLPTLTTRIFEKHGFDEAKDAYQPYQPYASPEEEKQEFQLFLNRCHRPTTDAFKSKHEPPDLDESEVLEDEPEIEDDDRRTIMRTVPDGREMYLPSVINPVVNDSRSADQPPAHLAPGLAKYSHSRFILMPSPQANVDVSRTQNSGNNSWMCVVL